MRRVKTHKLNILQYVNFSFPLFMDRFGIMEDEFYIPSVEYVENFPIELNFTFDGRSLCLKPTTVLGLINHSGVNRRRVHTALTTGAKRVNFQYTSRDLGEPSELNIVGGCHNVQHGYNYQTLDLEKFFYFCHSNLFSEEYISSLFGFRKLDMFVLNVHTLIH